MADAFLPYGRQSIDDDDIAAVVAALRGEMLTTGPRVASFEQAFARAVGADHAVACNSGTAALHLMMLAQGIGPGDAVIVPAITFLATANAARYVGADVIFADVDPDSGLITPDTLAEAASRVSGRRLRAVLPVHLNGWVADLEGLSALAASHGAILFEDACHALGGVYGAGEGMNAAEGHRVGSCRHSLAASFSLHPVKTITMGEGGVVTTNDAALAMRMRRYRTHGMVRDAEAFLMAEQAFGADGAPNPWYYEMPELGWNYRATDFACALGESQLTKLDRFVARRAALSCRYDSLLASLPHVRPVPPQAGQRPGLHLYVVHISFADIGKDRARVMRELAARGIGTQVHYLPVYRQPYYRSASPTPPLPGAEHYYAGALSLPLYPTMADDDVDRVVAALRAVLSAEH